MVDTSAFSVTVSVAEWLGPMGMVRVARVVALLIGLTGPLGWMEVETVDVVVMVVVHVVVVVTVILEEPDGEWREEVGWDEEVEEMPLGELMVMMLL